jgi:hypothetical protein
MTNKQTTKQPNLHSFIFSWQITPKEEQQIKGAQCFCGTSAQLGSISK